MFYFVYILLDIQKFKYAVKNVENDYFDIKSLVWNIWIDLKNNELNYTK